MKTWENMTGTGEQAQAELLKENLSGIARSIDVALDSTQTDIILAAKPELAQFIEKTRKFQEELHTVAKTLEIK